MWFCHVLLQAYPALMVFLADALMCRPAGLLMSDTPIIVLLLLSAWWTNTGWRFGTWFMFPYIGNVIIPTDFHIFQRGRSTTNQNISPTFSSSGWIAAIHFDVDPSGLNCFASDSIDSIRSGQLLRGDWKKTRTSSTVVPGPHSPLVGDFPWPIFSEAIELEPKQGQNAKSSTLSSTGTSPNVWGFSDLDSLEPTKKTRNVCFFLYGSSMGYRHNCFWTRKSCWFTSFLLGVDALKKCENDAHVIIAVATGCCTWGRRKANKAVSLCHWSSRVNWADQRKQQSQSLWPLTICFLAYQVALPKM